MGRKPDNLTKPNRRRALVLGAGAAASAYGLVKPESSLAGSRNTPRLEITGNLLLRGGTPIRLLGVGVGDGDYVRANRPLSDYQMLASEWHCNSVRISVHPGYWRHDKAQSLLLLKANVAAARNAGLIVVIDWHAIGFPGRYVENVDPSWGLKIDAFDSDENLAADFWSTVAREFGQDPEILMELWNEPVYDGSLWKSTGEHWPILKAAWLKLLGIVRLHSDAIVIVAGGRWAHDLKGVARDLIDDPRVAYAWHCYPNEDKGIAGRWPDSLDGLPAIKPVIVSEWGFTRDGDEAIRGTPEDFGEPFVNEILEGYRLHSFAWCFSQGATPQLLAPDGKNPSEYGAFVKTYLQRASRQRRPD